MKVLLADDSELILKRLTEAVSSFTQVEIVALCKNGAEALTAIRNLKPDLAIVDIKMPGLTGLEVLTNIRKDEQPVKFILLTLYASGYYQQMAIKAGADYFFSKVDDFEKVSQVLGEMEIQYN